MEQPPPQLLLDPDAVRLRASSIPGCIEIKPSSSSIPSLTKVTNDDDDLKYICSFLVGYYNNNNNNNETTGSTTLLTNPFLLLDQQQQQRTNNYIQNLARVTIYCKTGTIAIGRILYNTPSNNTTTNTSNDTTISSSSCKNEELYKKIRHIFRKNVSSLDIVERCLRIPTEIQTIDWNLIYNNNNDTNGATNTSKTDNHHHYLSITNNLELMNIGIAILNSEREKLIQHVYTIEKQQQQSNVQLQQQSKVQVQQERQQSSNTTTATQSQSLSTRTGTEFQFSLAINPMKHVDQCLNDIQQMNKYVTWVTTNGIGTVFLYGNGGVAYTPNIPLLLYQHLIQLRSNSSSKAVRNHRPKYIVLGTNERFFVIFYNNTYYYNINTKKYKNILDSEIQKISKDNQPPLSIAFGKNDDTIFIIYYNGTYQYYGKSIPYDLIQCLTTLQHQHKNTNNQNSNSTLRLSSVALGPNNEWFIRKQPSSTNHNDVDEQLIYYGNISYEMELAIRDIINDGHVIQYLDFGENYSYFISYD